MTRTRWLRPGVSESEVTRTLTQAVTCCRPGRGGGAARAGLVVSRPSRFFNVFSFKCVMLFGFKFKFFLIDSDLPSDLLTQRHTAVGKVR